jgi:opacity protein-like surface antigen
MSSKFLVAVTTIVYLCAGGISMRAQVNPSATGGTGLPVTVGVAYSNFDADWASSRLQGFAVWADVRPFHVTPWLNRASIEGEFRVLDLGHTTVRLRQNTYQLGVKYDAVTWHRFTAYGKFLGGWGHLDYALGAIPASPNSTSKTEGMYSIGGGGSYQLTRRIAARAEYEYQIWPDLAGRGTALTPNGPTVGVTYSFGRLSEDRPSVVSQ